MKFWLIMSAIVLSNLLIMCFTNKYAKYYGYCYDIRKMISVLLISLIPLINIGVTVILIARAYDADCKVFDSNSKISEWLNKTPFMKD